jgi:exonuclease III
MEEMQNIVNEFSYDVLALNEVKPKNGEISDVETLNIKGYTLFSSDFSKADTRGVCVYLKNHLTASQIFPKSVAVFNDVVWMSITENGGSEKFLFGCVYRSGTRNTAKKYDKALYEHLLWASQEYGYCKKVIVGDFNMPNVEWNPGQTSWPRFNPPIWKKRQLRCSISQF